MGLRGWRRRENCIIYSGAVPDLSLFYVQAFVGARSVYFRYVVIFFESIYSVEDPPQ